MFQLKEEIGIIRGVSVLSVRTKRPLAHYSALELLQNKIKENKMLTSKL
jgi:hypothetical protein